MARRRPLSVSQVKSGSTGYIAHSEAVKMKQQKRRQDVLTKTEADDQEEIEEEDDDDSVDEEDPTPSRKPGPRKKLEVIDVTDHNPNNEKSFELGEDLWTTRFTPITLGMLDPPQGWSEQQNPRDLLDISRKPRKGTRALPLKDWSVLPFYIHENPSMVHLEVLFRVHTHFGYQDVMARQPLTAVRPTAAKRRVAVNGFNNTRAREVRSAKSLNTRAWSGRHENRAPRVQVRQLDSLTQEQLDLNTTWTITPQGISPPTNSYLVFPHGVFVANGEGPHVASKQINTEAKRLDELQCDAENLGLEDWSELKDSYLPKEWTANKGITHKMSGKRRKQYGQRREESESEDDSEIEEPKAKRKKTVHQTARKTVRRSVGGKKRDESDDDEEDEPESSSFYDKDQLASQKRGRGKSAQLRPTSFSFDSDDDEEEDKVVATGRLASRPGRGKGDTFSTSGKSGQGLGKGAYRGGEERQQTPQEIVYEVSDDDLEEILFLLPKDRLERVIQNVVRRRADDLVDMISSEAINSPEQSNETDPTPSTIPPSSVPPIDHQSANTDEVLQATQAILDEGTARYKFPNLKPEVELQAMNYAQEMAKKNNLTIPNPNTVQHPSVEQADPPTSRPERHAPRENPQTTNMPMYDRTFTPEHVALQERLRISSEGPAHQRGVPVQRHTHMAPPPHPMHWPTSQAFFVPPGYGHPVGEAAVQEQAAHAMRQPGGMHVANNPMMSGYDIAPPPPELDHPCSNAFLENVTWGMPYYTGPSGFDQEMDED